MTLTLLKNRNPEDIAAEWLRAKACEAKASKLRVELEGELIALLGAKEEGSASHDLDGFKVKITGKLSRKIDWKAFDAVADQIPADMQPVKVERKLDEAGVKYLQTNAPAVYAVLAKALTITPAKTAVEVVRVEG